MPRLSVVALASLLVSAFATPADAKGRTVRITLDTVSTQAQPVEISGHAAARFYIWEGLGVSINHVPQMDGFIADWRKGPVERRPDAVQRYRVSFYIGCLPEERSLCTIAEPLLSYVVLYEYDAAAGRGYVYLPGKGEDGYAINIRSLVRGVEGKWFAATAEWQDSVASTLRDVDVPRSPGGLPHLR